MAKFRILCAAAALACSATFASAGEDTRVYVAHLLGGHELPVAGDPNAFGVATLVITLPAQVCYSIVLRSPVAATAAHVHAGGGGTAGGVVFALPVNAAIPNRVANCIAAPAAALTAIRNNPSQFYVNVHNVPFPGGAARGQLQ
ncbi:MAG: CHRD domain-containing protein [Aestuariivirga sp.]